MARAQFQKGQKVWVESVGVWSRIDQVNATWAKGFDEPVRVTYDVGLGRDFQANELMLPVDDPMADNGERWRTLRARNKWQDVQDCAHHPLPGTYPIVVTDPSDWGGWRVPGAEYDRNPDKIEYQARLIAAAPRMKALLERLLQSVDESPEDAPPETREVAAIGREILRDINEMLVSPSTADGPARAA
jgi:hypothetical protein